MSGNWDQPSPPPYTRRPWDEILQEFAEQTGRPIWPVTRVTPISPAWKRIEAAS